MNNYKFRIAGSNTTVDIVKDRVNNRIGDAIVGLYSYEEPVMELGQYIVYGTLKTKSPLDNVRKSFALAFSPEYIPSVDPDNDFDDEDFVDDEDFIDDPDTISN